MALPQKARKLPEFFTKEKTREKEKAGDLFFEGILAARGCFSVFVLSNKSAMGKL